MQVKDGDILYDFASSFIHCIVDAIHSEKLDPLLKKPSRWMKHTAHQFFAVDWSKYHDSHLQPPYKIWLENDEIIEITKKDLQIWRDAKLGGPL